MPAKVIIDLYALLDMSDSSVDILERAIARLSQYIKDKFRRIACYVCKKRCFISKMHHSS